MRERSAITDPLKAEQAHSQQTQSKKKWKRFDLKLELQKNCQERDGTLLLNIYL